MEQQDQESCVRGWVHRHYGGVHQQEITLTTGPSEGAALRASGYRLTHDQLDGARVS